MSPEEKTARGLVRSWLRLRATEPDDTVRRCAVTEPVGVRGEDILVRMLTDLIEWERAYAARAEARADQAERRLRVFEEIVVVSGPTQLYVVPPERGGGALRVPEETTLGALLTRLRELEPAS